MYKLKIIATDSEYNDLFSMEQEIKNLEPWVIANYFLDLTHELNTWENRKIAIDSISGKPDLDKLADMIKND